MNTRQDALESLALRRDVLDFAADIEQVVIDSGVGWDEVHPIEVAARLTEAGYANADVRVAELAAALVARTDERDNARAEVARLSAALAAQQETTINAQNAARTIVSQEVEALRRVHALLDGAALQHMQDGGNAQDATVTVGEVEAAMSAVEVAP